MTAYPATGLVPGTEAVHDRVTEVGVVATTRKSVGGLGGLPVVEGIGGAGVVGVGVPVVGGDGGVVGVGVAVVGGGAGVVVGGGAVGAVVGVVVAPAGPVIPAESATVTRVIEKSARRVPMVSTVQ